MDITKIRLIDKIKCYEKVILVVAFSIILFIVAANFNDEFVNMMSVTGYLTWHIIFEFTSVLVSFSIFTVTYFIYTESGSLRMIILGCAFLAMGLLDAFHALSFKGMADFFISNDTANRATTLWVLSRTIGCIGFLISIYIPYHRKSNIKNNIFAFVTVIISIALFLGTTYTPDIFPVMLIEGQGLTKIKLVIEYFIILVLGYTFILVAVEYEKTRLIREYIFLVALILLIFSEFAFTNYGSVYDAYNYLGHIYKIIAFMILYKAIYIENISIPYREMKKARTELKEYSDNLNIIVKQRTKELEDMNNVLMTDIEYAKEIQRCLLPINMPQDKPVSFSAEYIPAQRLSGDFYNVIKLDENNIAIYIGDVSGHGVSAAMLTVFAHQNIKPLKEEENYNELISPGYVLKTIFRDFNKTNFNVETYIVMLYGVYNINNKRFTYASAGINVPPYIIKGSGEVVEMDVKGFPICKLGDYYVPFYDDREVQLETGDKILFYSDGLVEAKNIKNEVNGQEKIKEFLKYKNYYTANELHDTIKSMLYKHIGKNGKLKDDITYLIMEIS